MDANTSNIVEGTQTHWCWYTTGGGGVGGEGGYALKCTNINIIFAGE